MWVNRQNFFVALIFFVFSFADFLLGVPRPFTYKISKKYEVL